jgi:hypothetical protein
LPRQAGLSVRYGELVYKLGADREIHDRDYARNDANVSAAVTSCW